MVNRGRLCFHAAHQGLELRKEAVRIRLCEGNLLNLHGDGSGAARRPSWWLEQAPLSVLQQRPVLLSLCKVPLIGKQKLPFCKEARQYRLRS